MTVEGSMRLGALNYDVNDLENLTKVGRNFSISINGTDRNTDLTGLKNLTDIGGDIEIGGYNVKNLIGFAFLIQSKKINGNLTIAATILQNIDELSNITNIEGGIVLSGNQALLNLDGLSNLVSIGGGLSIWGNRFLKSLDGLKFLENTSELVGLSIVGNKSISNLDVFSNLKSIEYNLRVERTDIKDLDSFANLEYVGNDLIIEANYSLTDLCGLNNLLSRGSLQGEFRCLQNGLNPSKQNIIDDNCKL